MEGLIHSLLQREVRVCLHFTNRQYCTQEVRCRAIGCSDLLLLLLLELQNFDFSIEFPMLLTETRAIQGLMPKRGTDSELVAIHRFRFAVIRAQ